LTPLLRHDGRLASATFSADGKQVVTLSQGGAESVWDLPAVPELSNGAGEERQPPEQGGPGGEQRIYLNNGVTVRGPSRTAGPVRSAPPGDRLVEQAVFSPDGRRVVVSEHDTAVRVWDTTSGEPLTSPLRHRGIVRYVAFSPDGFRLITACDDRTARVWDTVSGEVLAAASKHTLPIQRVFFRGAGEQVCIVHDGGYVCTWDLSPDRRAIDELVALAQVQAGGVIDEKQEYRALAGERLHAVWEKLYPPR
jgi:WD40 repeat protein